MITATPKRRKRAPKRAQRARAYQGDVDLRGEPMGETGERRRLLARTRSGYPTPIGRRIA